MERFSPKIEIINHFDNLINRIDIDIDSSLEKYNDQQLLSEILLSSEKNKKGFRERYFEFYIELFDSIDSLTKSNLNSWSESMKVVDYLNQIRIKTIDELKIAQEETLDYYKINSEYFKSEQTKDIEELRSELFAKKFYFQVNFKQSESFRLWPFSVFTFVTDFYMSQSSIDSLEKLINDEEKPFGLDPVFDDKMVLTGLLYKCFIDNLLNIPAHVIHVSKQDVLNIESIDFNHKYIAVNLTTSSSSIDLSKIVELNLIARKFEYWRESIEYNIEGLSSLKTLHLRAYTSKVDLSIKNIPLLRNLSFSFGCKINDDIITSILDQVPHIQELCLNGDLSYFNLDNFVNLRVLSLSGFIKDQFNFELFKNLCNQLEAITISFCYIKEKNFFKLFDGYNFPYLEDFTINFLDIKRLTKEFMSGFPTLRKLNITQCEIDVIENDLFSNMQQLTSLNLRRNEIKFIEENAFSNLKNLQTLDLSDNFLKNFDPKFVGLIESAEYSIKKSTF